MPCALTGVFAGGFFHHDKVADLPIHFRKCITFQPTRLQPFALGGTVLAKTTFGVNGQFLSQFLYPAVHFFRFLLIVAFLVCDENCIFIPPAAFLWTPIIGGDDIERNVVALSRPGVLANREESFRDHGEPHKKERREH